MSENNGHIYVYNIARGRDEQPRGSNLFQNYKFHVYVFIYSNIFPTNHFRTVFPNQTHGRPNVILQLDRSESESE